MENHNLPEGNYLLELIIRNNKGEIVTGDRQLIQKMNRNKLFYYIGYSAAVVVGKASHADLIKHKCDLCNAPTGEDGRCGGLCEKYTGYDSESIISSAKKIREVLKGRA